MASTPVSQSRAKKSRVRAEKHQINNGCRKEVNGKQRGAGVCSFLFLDETKILQEISISGLQ